MTSTARQRGRQILRAQRDRLRGFSVNRKALGFAICIEVAIIGSSLFAGIQFANIYADDPSVMIETKVASLAPVATFIGGHSQSWWMAIIGAIALCVAETARLPLAAAFRSHRSMLMRIFAILGVVLCCGITIKAMSQVLQQAYSPRLHLVQKTNVDLKLAEADLSTIAAKRGSADKALEPLQRRIDEANRRITELKELIAQQGEAPKPYKTQHCWIGPKTKKRFCKDRWVTPTWAGQDLVDKLDAAYAERDAAVAAHASAALGVASEVDRFAVQERHVTEMKNAQRVAISNSQLHQFVGMLYGIDPLDVSEQQLHVFLKLFVFLPSIFIAMASSLLAMTAYTRIKPLPISTPKEIRVPSDNDGTLSEYIKGIVRQTATSPTAKEAQV